MNSLIFYLGTFYVLVGTIFLTVPIIYLELGKPKDLIRAFLNLSNIGGNNQNSSPKKWVRNDKNDNIKV